MFVKQIAVAYFTLFLKHAIISMVKLMKKNWIEKLKKFYFQYHDIIYLVLPFLWLDFSLQLLGSEIAYFPLWIFMPELFTAIWLFLIINICLNSKRKYGFSFYILFLIIAFILLIQNIINLVLVV